MGIDDCVNIKIDHILRIDKWKISKKTFSVVAVRIAVIDLISLIWFFSCLKFWLDVLICDFCCGVRKFEHIFAGVRICANFGAKWLVCEKKTMIEQENMCVWKKSEQFSTF